MIVKMRPVTVRTIPARVTEPEVNAFLQELREYAETQRPRVVLDCSRLRRMDSAAIQLILSCLEVAMKLNGNVKLASLRPLAQATLKSAGIDRLFEIYMTVADADVSYQRVRSGGAPRGHRLNSAEDGAEGRMGRGKESRGEMEASYCGGVQ